jgi:hypothetical protein
MGTGLFGARHEGDRHALVVGELGSRPGQRGLAAAGGPHDHGAAVFAYRFLQELELTRTTGEWPGTRDDTSFNGCPADIERHL